MKPISSYKGDRPLAFFDAEVDSLKAFNGGSWLGSPNYQFARACFCGLA
jgi:hypothetical protein